ncbi:uncharacterized conserved protein [Serpentinimonas maccroryi]|uniref:Uncharacterized conserved protein n=1 Tax=Serpentinimonas maccroryi TaxID=1458426 RepID=A0A060NYC4_9BURK|nr:uncharacterized conserved protein [Serpentinimonas maccroryi]
MPAADVLRMAEETGAIPYDIPGVEYGHRGELCSFDTFLDRHDLKDPALRQLAVIVRGADTDRLDLAPQCANLLARERPLDSKQMRLDLASPSVHECGKLWEYAVYVTDVDYPLESIAQLYRDRAAVGKAASHANQTTLYLTNAASMVAAWALRAHRLAAGE